MSDQPADTPPPKLFCFGYGYTAAALGSSLSQENWKVSGTTRDSEKMQTLREDGIGAYLFDAEHPLGDPLYIMANTTHVLLSIPPDDNGDAAYQLHAADIAALPNLKWVGYLSTTGVYGNRNGGWVDEKSECRPTSKRGNRRVKAERQWMTLFERQGIPLHIFRLAGIYGPGRSALDSVRVGTARRIEKPGHAFSRIHIDDIVNFLRWSMDHPDPGQIYNLADDVAAPSHEVIAYAATLLDKEPPPLIPYGSVDMAPIAHSFYRDNKRVSNLKIKDSSGLKLLYPSYREGLEACLKADESE